jgi:hypothetical protein
MPPDSLAKDFTIEVLKDGTWQKVTDMIDNHNRIVTIPINDKCDALRVNLSSNWAGEDNVTLFAFEVR